jgi:hypothetical protein
MLEIRRAQGRLDEVVETTRQSNRAVNLVNRAAVLCDLDRTADAQELFRPLAGDRFGALPLDFSWLQTMAACADVARALDDRKAAGCIADALEPWRDQFAYTTLTCRGSIERPLGVALATARRYGEASDALARAAQRHEAVSAPIELARTKVDWARTLASRAAPGDRHHARELLGEAEASARQLGLRTVERDSQRAMAALVGT